MGLKSKHFLTPDTFRRYEIIDAFLFGEEGTFLDLGCGNCKMQYFLNKERIKFVGVDININSLIDAMRNLHRVIRADANFLPFKQGSLKGIICSEVLEHIFDDESLIKELNRVLQVGGICIITVPNSECEKVLPLRGLTKNMYEVLCKKVGHLRKGYSLQNINIIFSKNSFQMLMYKYDLKFVGALWTLFYYYWFAKVEENRLRKFIISFYERFDNLLANLYSIDNFSNKEGFTIFVKFRKVCDYVAK